MKLLDFISLEFDNSDLTTQDDIERLINGNSPSDKTVPSLEIPVTLDPNEISRIFPSQFDDNWTDVFLKDGDILTAQMPLPLFKIKWLEAREEILEKQAFKDLSYLDEELKIRVYQN